MCYTSNMHVRDLFSLEDENRAIGDGYLTIRESRGLRVYNYSDKAAVDGESWNNPAVLNSRGLIVDNFGEVVARPWKKFFNYNQPQAGELDYQAPVEVTDKADGSLVIVAPYQGTPSGLIASTRGSLESDQAKHAQYLLDTPGTLWDGYNPGDIVRNSDITPLFEVIYSDNRIVLNYGDVDTLVLLGGVVIESGDYLGPQDVARFMGWKGPVTAVMTYETLQEALEAKPRPNAEGLVVRFLNEDKLVKIKQSDYVIAHRAIFGMNELRIWEAQMNEVSLNDLLEPLPDEVHSWVTEVYEGLEYAVYSFLSDHYAEADRISGILPKGYSRKEYAAEVIKSKEEGYNPAVLFLIEDENANKAWKTILNALRPTGGGERPTLEQLK